MQMNALLDYVLPDVPSCPRAFALDKVRLSAREFFSRAAIWRQYVSPNIDVVAGTRSYAITVDPVLEADVTGFIQAWYRGTKIWPRSIRQLNEMYADLDSATGTPSYYNLSRINYIDVYPKPNISVTTALNAWCVLAPKTDSDYLRDEDDHWKEAIALGAKAKIMAVPAKPYTNLQYGIVLGKQFDTKVAEARSWFETGQGDFSGGEITTFIDR